MSLRFSRTVTLGLGLVLTPVLAWAQAAQPSPTGQPAAKPAAQAAAPVEESTSIKLVLYPAAEPKPALKYQLLPPLLERRPGNAAVHYGKVKSEQNHFFGNADLQNKIADWANGPLEKFPKEEARKALGADSIFKTLERAARCETCDWDLPIREEEFISMRLPEVQESRSFGRLLAAKARLQMADGQYDEAVRTLQTGYALGRHVGQGPTIINGLVGITICGVMSHQVRDLMQQPGTPSLYWALSNLPRPLVDMRPGFEAEMAMLYLSYPELRDLEHKDYPPQYWQQLLDKMVERWQLWGDGRSSPELERLTGTAMVLRGYPMAKRALIAWGRKPGEVEAMPVAQVIMLYTMRTYDELRDDLFKWFALPLWEANPGLNKAEEDLKKAIVEGREVLPIAALLLPALRAASVAGARTDREIAVLRILEALRLYGAAHDGRLPDKLGDVTEAPIPNDPVTGKEFLYRKAGDTAVLDAQTPSGYSAQSLNWLPYEIKFAAKGKRP